MHVQDIEAEIDQLKDQLAYWESYLREIQQNCNHDFQQDPFYKKCLKCKKTEAIYY